MQSRAEARSDLRFSREDDTVKFQSRSGSTRPALKLRGARCQFRMKCANPQCSRASKHQQGGRIFRLRLWPAATHRVPDYLVRYFWLCVSCSCAFTLVFDERHGVSLAPLHDAGERETKSTLIFDISAAHSHMRAIGRIADKQDAVVGLKLNDQEEVHDGRNRILTRKTRSR